VIAYRLTFDGPLRKGRTGDAFPRSDTLMAAIVHALAALGDDASSVAASPPFALSSCFPFTRRGHDVHYFWPTPLGARDASSADSPASRDLQEARAGAENAPNVSAVPNPPETAPAAAAAQPAVVRNERAPRFVSSAWFRYLLGGDGDAPARHSLQDGVLRADSPGPARLWATESRARQPLDRETRRPLRAATRSELVRFSRGSGLFFLAAGKDAAARSLLESALAYLGDEGFGRTAPFTFEADELAVPTPGGAGKVLLSLYHPTRAEVAGGVLRGGRYTFELRGGVHESGSVRAAVRMIAEGARLGSGGTPVGSSVVVAPAGSIAGVEHAVYRSGYALWAPAPVAA